MSEKPQPEPKAWHVFVAWLLSLDLFEVLFGLFFAAAMLMLLGPVISSFFAEAWKGIVAPWRQ